MRIQTYGKNIINLTTNKMNELKKNIEKVFALARMQMVNANPGNEQELIALINLKVELLAELEKVPQDKKK
jgi:hypothetical protein